MLVEINKNNKQLTLEDCSIVHMLDKSKMKPGLGFVCEICQCLYGYAPLFPTSIDAYADHWFEKHKEQGYSIYATEEDLTKAIKAQGAKQRTWLLSHWKDNLKTAAETPIIRQKNPISRYIVASWNPPTELKLRGFEKASTDLIEAEAQKL
jgi:hypothetical protein